MKSLICSLELVFNGATWKLDAAEPARKLEACQLMLRAIADLAADSRMILKAFDVDENDLAATAASEAPTVTIPASTGDWTIN